MTTKARLKYFDSNNNSVVIGTLNGDNGSGIDELTLRNSGRQYTNVVVSGSQSLFGSFPTKSNEVTTQNNADGPEIFLEVFNQTTNQFEIRDRVYAESQGVVSNNGQFKHKRLYGFEKFTGRQRVEITNPVTTDIEDVLQTALPTGYTVQAEAPSGGSIPSVNNYTFKGKRSEVYKALQENYDYLIFFTGETDSNDDYIVRLEPRGFGGQVDTFEKGVDPVFFEKWTKNDELRRITEAEVIGTNSSNQKVQATASTNPNNGRFTRKNVTYIENQSEAKEIAVSLIAADSDGGTPQDVEHGRINAPIDTPPANNLNKSVQVINSEINVDDLFTVVEQKDFFHQSQVMYSFEFEKELTAREQQDKKDLGNRNAELITDSLTDVGGQGTSGVETGTANAQVSDSGHSDHGVDNSTDGDNASVSDSGHSDHGVDNSTGNDGGHSEINNVSTSSTGVNGSSGAFAQLGSVTASNQNGEGGDLYFTIQVAFNETVNTTFSTIGVNHDLVVRDKTNGQDIPGSFIVQFTRHHAFDNNADGSSDQATTEVINGKIHIPENPNGNEYELRARPNFNVIYGSEITLVEYDEHSHASGSLDDGSGSANVSDSGHSHASGSLDDGLGTSNPSDSGHGDPNDPSEHIVSGTTDTKNIQISTEDKTNR